MQKKSFRFDKKVCVGNALSLDTSSKLLGNFEGILGNPGEISHIGRKTLGVYRVKHNLEQLLAVPKFFTRWSNMFVAYLCSGGGGQR